MNSQVVVIGGGFGGLTVVQELQGSNSQNILISRTNHHLFQPLLYQVATAALSPADIASPLRSILRFQKNVRVIMDEVTEINREDRRVILAEGDPIPYDFLVVAPGSSHSYFGREEWRRLAPGLKTLADALTIREHLIFSFEHADRLEDKQDRKKYLTFIIVGGGPTGVEIAGALAEIAKKVVIRDFRRLKSEELTILLLEGSDHLLSGFAPSQRAYAKRSLEKIGVDVRLNARVTDISDSGVYVGNNFIESVNLIWAAGNRASPLLETLKVQLDHQGRVMVQPDLSISGDPSVFVIGDAAALYDEHGKALPALAPVAMQQARYVAKIICSRIPPDARRPFLYHDKGTMATIGRAKAVAEVGQFRFSGLIAWLLWSFVHIFFLIGFRNRFRVMSEWIWYYFTYKPGAQLIYWKIREEESQDDTT